VGPREPPLFRFGNRVLPFDARAADLYGDLVVARERAGMRLEGFDGLIAAIAKSRELPIATRNSGDFDGLGIDLINPWRIAQPTRSSP
jgi:toxin FitB